MATKKTAPESDDLLAQLDSLGSQATSRPTKTSTQRPSKQTTSQSEQELLEELGNLASQRPLSRPGTPSLRPNPASSAGNRSPKRSAAPTPPPGRASEEKSSNGQRKSGDSNRSSHPGFTPVTTTTDESPEPTPRPASTKSGSWWGGLLSTATAAVSQAQAAVKEIQKNEEAQRWAEQVRGNLDGLRGLGMLSLTLS